MNQLELNRIAMHFIRSQSIEVAVKLRELLYEDVEERSEQIAGPALHYIHNIALFDCLVGINTFFMNENNSHEAVKEYTDHAGTLRPKFLDIMEALRDFRPTAQGQDDSKSQK
jgi:hypothetical protein